MKKQLLLVCFLVLGFTTLTQAADFTISINQFVEHPALDAVLKGFQDYFTEKGIAVDYKIHNAQANQGTATQIATQMIGEQPDLLMAIATPSAQACAQALDRAPANMKRPFLFTAVTDPVAAGLVKNLEQPGGLISGVSDLLPVEDHIRMVLEYKPDIKTLGVLYNAGEANSKATVATIMSLSEKLGYKVIESTAARTADVFQAARSLVGRVDAIFIPTDNTIISALENVLKVGIRNQLPVFAADVDSVKRGAVAAMGFDYYRHGYQTGPMAEKILNGAKPGTLPVEFQKDLELHINATASEKMGVTPPQALLEKATQIYR
ncbi:MAG: ABC transporter permease [Deltaproteobacteria bacterium]|nr:MAG: ABC transporter permease [Deltaproteobacteria bacterium]